MIARLVLLLSVLVLVAPPAGRAQTKVYRIGYLTLYSAASNADAMREFFDALRALGYEQGRNLVIEGRYADGYGERLPDLARDLVKTRVDLIVAITTPAALAAKRATSTVPIVIPSSAEAVGSGLVQSLGRPGGNVTGLQFVGPEVAVKQIELLREIAPTATRLAWLANTGVTAEFTFRRIERDAPRLGITARFVRARMADDYPAAFASMATQGLNGLVVAPTVSNHEGWQRVIELAATHRVPAAYPGRMWVEAGGLMSYFTDRRQLFRRAASYVDKILKGAKPGDLPMEQPTKFELVINARTAKALGLTVPPSLRLRADQVIE